MKIAINNAFLRPHSAGDELQAELRERRYRLRQSARSADGWKERSYNILAILAPALSNHENKIEFPGDPMCLYGALSVSVRNSLRACASGLSDESPYNDNCPRWCVLPDSVARRRAAAGEPRDYALGLNGHVDATVFDSRVWNADVERYFRELIRIVRPRVLLISSVSPAYRYAARIATAVKEENDWTYIILGGRHADETLKYENGQIIATESCVLNDIAAADLEPVVDMVISGEGYFALAAALQAVSLAMPIPYGDAPIPPREVIRRLEHIAAFQPPVSGSAVIAVVEDPGATTAFPINGPPIDSSELPPPYEAFAVRAKFPIFTRASGEVCTTGHMLASGRCPFHCVFCSEARPTSRMGVFRGGDAAFIVERVMQLREWQADAIFFDDSILFSGDHTKIESFCRLLTETLDEQRRGGQLAFPFQWGGQLTVGIVEGWQQAGIATRVLEALRRASCTYLYFGLESLAGSIIEQIHKSKPHAGSGPWRERVRSVLRAVKSAGIRAGASILFGLEGETLQTIDDTIEEVDALLKAELLTIVSPNLMTYHPGTEITKAHGTENRLRLKNAELGEFIRPPYSFFEEAFPGMVSRELNEELIWHIHRETMKRWATGRNMNAMKPALLGSDQRHSIAPS